MTDPLPSDASSRQLPSAGRREGIGLCLSGGGFRAALFHLGALRRLNELGVLHRVDTISSVSGGSITSAHLATRIDWPLPGPLPGDVWEREVAAPLRAFTRRNLRTWPILRRWLLPWKWTRESTGVEGLIRGYRRGLPGLGRPLAALPDRPRFLFCATDMAFGVNWVFEKKRMGDYQAGYVSPPPEEWTIAHAVGASSCFPPIFNPLPVEIPAGLFKKGNARGPERDECLADLRLTDGGNYDNLGLEPVWKSHATVLVSDGGGIFAYSSDRGPARRLLRYADIADNQARSLRKRWLISSFSEKETERRLEGVYWGIGSARESFWLGRSAAGQDPVPREDAYSEEVARRVIAAVRTDLDAFSEAEIAVLENHGYLLADAAVARRLPQFLTGGAPPLTPPHQQWLGDDRALQALRDSSRRKPLGRWS